jgi:hypothetical protein
MKPTQKIIAAIRRYQVPGSAGEFDARNFTNDHGWKEHVPGTITSFAGRILLGMPKGFNRCGPIDPEQVARWIWIYATWEEKQAHWPYGILNVPVWKYLDEHGNTIVRGLSPRVNTPFLHVILGDHRGKIRCAEITNKELEEMD